MRLTDQIAIVTGASRGIGRTIAVQFAAEGATVALAARNEAQLREVDAIIRAAGGNSLPIPTDVTDPVAVAAMVATVEARLGPVDLLVNDAGRFLASGPVWEMDADLWWGDVTVNLRGVFLCSQAVIRHMVTRGSGRIINLIGRGYDIPFPNGSGYAASKAAVMRFTETMAAEAGCHGVIVFAMAPGLVQTALTDYHMQKTNATELWPHVVQAFAEGKDVPSTLGAALAVELASGRYDALSGKVFEVADDMEQISEHLMEIQGTDLYTLRVQRWQPA